MALVAVYLLELDRQENRTQENALAQNWWIPFKYKLTKTLVDERDGSIFGAILEWDRSAAMIDLVLIRPSGAPKAVLALRGTLLKSPTMRRDIEDYLCFLAWESLKGYVMFKVALEVLKSVSDAYGSNNVCIAGHSLGAGFALQVGKALAKEGIYVETHLFNPPSVLLAMSLRNIGEKAELVWKRLKSMLPSSSEEAHVSSNDRDKNLMHNLNREAHGLEQWWSNDAQLQQAIHNSKLISKQLKSLYTSGSPSQEMLGKPR
ncbi:Alpha/Beta hydrolase fold [Sesbania bispinosa]|nr:Alpha/Beta hydrolase fold [Sesbania bispinosa]